MAPYPRSDSLIGETRASGPSQGGLMRRIKIGIVGFGKIACDQHVPALMASTEFELVAVTAGSQPPPPDVRVFSSIDDLLSGVPDLEAIALCTPPQGRHTLARTALRHGLHVLMEKPPGQSLSEVEELIPLARSQSVALFATWHSREAAAVAAAREWLSAGVIHDLAVIWKEDVRRWHPGQAWIWEPGGFGVFDPGINALSIVTHIFPRPVYVTAAELHFPANRAMPIAVELRLADALGTPLRADFDFRQTGPQSWDIHVTTSRGQMRLADGGATLWINDASVAVGPSTEYPHLYRRFAALVQQRAVDVDLAPLRLVADAFMLGRRHVVEDFVD